jgi:hypothetical protein
MGSDVESLSWTKGTMLSAPELNCVSMKLPKTVSALSLSLAELTLSSEFFEPNVATPKDP